MVDQVPEARRDFFGDKTFIERLIYPRSGFEVLS